MKASAIRASKRSRSNSLPFAFDGNLSGPMRRAFFSRYSMQCATPFINARATWLAVSFVPVLRR